MAEYLTAFGKVLTSIAVLLACAPAQAQDLADPMRPPAALDIRREQSSGPQTGGPVLQSVLIGPTRKVAVISGQTVALGEKFGELHVVKITETEVVLRSGKEMQTLKLFPDVEKRPGSRSRAEGTGKQ